MQESLMRGTITIATSIMPRRIEAQQAAINSWLKLGFDVVSVNVQTEIELLSHLFPRVNFITASHKSRTSHLVSISDILAALAESGATICGIVNSDIMISTNDDFISFLFDNTNDKSLIFGSRIDVHDINSLAGTPYSIGYDYFFFRNELFPLDLVDDFYLGATWWDFWFPISLAIKGVRLRQLIVPVGYHLKHDQVWNINDLEIGRKKFISAIREMLRINEKSSELSDRFRAMINAQGMEVFAGQIPLTLLFNSELVVYGSKSLPVETIAVIVDFLKIHCDRYEMFFKSRSWRWTAPARFLTSRYRALINYKIGHK